MNNPDELAGLPEDVREAVVAIDHGNGVFVDSDDGIGDEKWRIVRAELLRLAAENAGLMGKVKRTHDWNTDLLTENKRLADELAASRETIKRLNRRVQVAEAGIAEKVKVAAPGSFGRGLANAAAAMFMRERDELRHAADEYMAAVAAYHTNEWDRVNIRQYDAAKQKLAALLPVGGDRER